MDHVVANEKVASSSALTNIFENFSWPAIEEKIRALFAALSALSTRRKIILAGTLLCVIAIVGYGWSTLALSQYKVLFSNLSDRDAGKITQSLTQLNVPYHLSDLPGAILVPAESVHEVRLKLAAQGLPRGSYIGFELMDAEKFGISQFAEQVNYQRALEGELARTIRSLQQVLDVRVHIAIPKASVFLSQQRAPTASVVVHLRGVLDAQQIKGIQHLVASSVPNLRPDNVSILDAQGSLLSADVNDPLKKINDQHIAYTHRLEEDYIKRIYRILEPITGAGNVRAEITADIDFSQQEEVSEEYSPNTESTKKAIRSEQLSLSGARGAAGGVPGVAGNTPSTLTETATAGSAGASTAAGHEQRASMTNYAVNKKIFRKHDNAYAVQRLTIAVIINDHSQVDKDGKVSIKPWEKTDLEKFDTLVKSSVGFRTDRGDSIQIINQNFQGAEIKKTTFLEYITDFFSVPGHFDLLKNMLFSFLFLGGGFYLIFLLLGPYLKELGNKIFQATTDSDETTLHTVPEVPKEDGSTDPKKELSSLDEFEQLLEQGGEQSYTNLINFMQKLAAENPEMLQHLIRQWLEDHKS